MEAISPSCPHCGDVHADGAIRCAKTGRALGGDSRLLGQLIDRRYRIVRVLGTGPFGAVYKAEHVTIGRSVALRVLPTELVRDADALSRFFEETKLVGSLSAPHLHPLVDAGISSEGLAYVAYAYVRGHSLGSALMVEGPFGVPQASTIVCDILSGLSALHQSGFVHRFLSPESVLLKPDAFGTSRAIVTNLAAVAARPSSSKEGGLGAGIYMPRAFVAPERIRGNAPDAREDLFAAGMVLSACLSPPGELLLGSRLLASRIPASIEAIVARATAPHPTVRFESAAAMRAALAGFALKANDEMGSVTATHISDLRSLSRREQAPSASSRLTVMDAALAKAILQSVEIEAEGHHVELARNAHRARAEVQELAGLRNIAEALERADAVLGTGDRLFCTLVGSGAAKLLSSEVHRTYGPLTPELFLDQVAPTWARGLGHTEGRATILGKGYGRLELRAHPEPRLAVCACFAGMLTEMLESLGGRNVELSKTACEAAGDRACIYGATWA